MHCGDQYNLLNLQYIVAEHSSRTKLPMKMRHPVSKKHNLTNVFLQLASGFCKSLITSRILISFDNFQEKTKGRRLIGLCRFVDAAQARVNS